MADGNGKSGAVMVVGGGIAGIQASLDLANSGFKVYLLEDAPAIGGTMAKLDKTFPTNDCAMCTMSPKLVECGRHLNIEFLPSSEILALEGEPGRFKASIYKRPRFIDLAKCTGCGECEKACPISVPAEFDEGLAGRKAVYRLFPQAFPNAFAIEKKARPPCQTSCPAGVHAQGYVALVAEGKYREAYDLIRRRNPLPAVCGRVCTHPCETSCRRGEYDEPVAIASIKRFVADYVAGHADEPAGDTSEIERRPEKVAVVGSGPAGLTAAYYLALEGYGVDVFEALPVAGGMLAVGIPEYRLPRKVLQGEIDSIKRAGVNIKLNSPVKSLSGLKEQGYNAVFVAAGAHVGRTMGIPGEDAGGVTDAIVFLRDVNLGKKVELGPEVAVVGGGNSAIDAARTALRLGAGHVRILYRRTRTEMPAAAAEVEAAVEEGVDVQFLTNPVEVFSDGGRLRAVKCIRMKLGEPDSSGRRRPIPIEGSEFELPLDTLIFAIRQEPDLAFLEGAGGISVTRWGTIETNPLTMATGQDGVFAGGDAVLGPSTVVESVAQGYEAAVSIGRHLRGEDLRAGRGEAVRELPLKKFPQFVKPAGRARMPELAPTKRKGSFDEVELGLDEEAARREAQRCLECGLCSECMECERVCEAGAVLHAMSGETLDLEVGGVILALGAERFAPTVKHEFGYAQFPNVITSLQFERILAASGPFMGHIQRPSDGAAPKRLAWLQCVGSRDEGVDDTYCSAVCCMYAIKEAIIAKEHEKDIEPTIFFMDIRAHGKDFDKYYERAQDEFNVRFVRSRVGKVEEAPGSRNLLVHHVLPDGTRAAEEFDMVVLSVGFKPSEEVAALAQRLGVRMNPYRFFHTSTLSPLATTRPGVFTCGLASSPKDIPETVMQASGAASEAAELLAEARGTKVVEKTYPPERDVRGEEARVGVFVCHCGINIGSVVDVPGVVGYVKKLPGVVYAEENLFTCSQDTQEKMKQIIDEHRLNRVVVASCTPRTHEPLFQETLREAGLNPRLFEMANIRDQCSWIHRDDPERATEKSKDLVRMAVAKARLLEPLPSVALPVNQKALIIGGGLAGMVSALSIADQGFEAALVEREPELGGNLRKLRFTMDGEELPDYLSQLIEKAESHPRLSVHKGAAIEAVEGYVGNYRTRLKVATLPAPVEIEHGVVIVATGAVESKPAEYLYGQDPRILTQLELEDQLVAAEALAPTRKKEKKAEPTAPERLKKASSVVMIQCVGSRDDERPYCSRVCCSQAVKNALRLKKLNPKVEIQVLYRDVRTYGFLESYYQAARQSGVTFIRYEKERKPVVEAADALTVRVQDPILGEEMSLEPDLVVLAPAIVPRDDAAELSRMLKVPLNEDRFFLEAHVKLRPVDFSADGVFLAGLAHAPKTVEETIAQAKAAAARACTIISKSEYLAEPIVAHVDEEVCSGCGVCTHVCPYEAPQLVTKNGRRVCEVNRALCKGCGSCASLCPSGAMQQLGFDAEQVGAMVEACLSQRAVATQ